MAEKLDLVKSQIISHEELNQKSDRELIAQILLQFTTLFQEYIQDNHQTTDIQETILSYLDLKKNIPIALNQSIKNFPQEVLKKTLSFLEFKDFFGVPEKNRYALQTVSKQFKQAIEKSPEIQEIFREFLADHHKIETYRFFFNSDRIKDRIIQGHSTVLQLLAILPPLYYAQPSFLLNSNSKSRKQAIALGVFPGEMYYRGFCNEHFLFLSEIVKAARLKGASQQKDHDSLGLESKDSHEGEEISISSQKQEERENNALVRKDLEAGIKQIDCLDELQVMDLNGLSRDQLGNDKFRFDFFGFRQKDNHKDHIKKYWEQLQKSNESPKGKLEKLRLEFERVKGLSVIQLNALKLFSIEDVTQPWFSFIHEGRVLDLFYHPEMLRGLTRRHLTLLQNIPYSEWIDFLKIAGNNQPHVQGFQPNEENLANLETDELKHIIYYNLTRVQYDAFPHLSKDVVLLNILRKKQYEFEEVVRFEKIHVHALKSGISLEIIKKYYKDLYQFDADELSLIVSEIKAKISAEQKEISEQQMQLSLDQRLELYLLEIRSLTSQQIKESRHLKQLSRYQLDAIKEFNLSFEQVANAWFKPEHLQALKIGREYHEIAVLNRLQARALATVPSLSRDQVTEPWFTKEHLEAIEQGFTFAEVQKTKNSDDVIKLRHAGTIQALTESEVSIQALSLSQPGPALLLSFNHQNTSLSNRLNSELEHTTTISINGMNSANSQFAKQT